mmetsp:Transcript_103787/g.278960  ORF Transcript_103787/g.278960 Transcript_103787/m.278960 type:complete len:417 (-) Transcript_103787:119-1369(-)
MRHHLLLRVIDVVAVSRAAALEGVVQAKSMASLVHHGVPLVVHQILVVPAGVPPESNGRHNDHLVQAVLWRLERKSRLTQDAGRIFCDDDHGEIFFWVRVVLPQRLEVREPVLGALRVGNDIDVDELEANLHVHGHWMPVVEVHARPGRATTEGLVGPLVLLPHHLLGDGVVVIGRPAHHVPRRDLQPVSLGHLGQLAAALAPPVAALLGPPEVLRLRVRDVVGPLVWQPEVAAGLVDLDAGGAAEAGHAEAAPGALQGAGAARRREPQARHRRLVAARVVRVGDHVAEERRHRVLHVLVERRPDLVVGEVQAPAVGQHRTVWVRHDKLQDVPRVAHGLRPAQQLPHPAVNLPVLLEFVSVLEVAVPLVHGSLLRTTMFSLIRWLNAGVNLGLLVRRVQLPHGQRVGQTGPQPEQR